MSNETEIWCPVKGGGCISEVSFSHLIEASLYMSNGAKLWCPVKGGGCISEVSFSPLIEASLYVVLWVNACLENLGFFVSGRYVALIVVLFHNEE